MLLISKSWDQTRLSEGRLIYTMFYVVQTLQWRDQEKRWKRQNGEEIKKRTQEEEDKKGKELVSELQKPKARASLMVQSDTMGLELLLKALN